MDRSMDESKSTNPFQVLPLFHFDVIARIVPGMLASYGLGWLDKLSEPSLAKVGFALIVAYWVGLLIDITSDLTHRVITHLPLFGSWYRNSQTSKLETEMLKHQANLNASDQLLISKMGAEKALLRITAFLSLVCWAWPPPKLVEWGHQPARCWASAAFVVATALFEHFRMRMGRRFQRIWNGYSTPIKSSKNENP